MRFRSPVLWGSVLSLSIAFSSAAAAQAPAAPAPQDPSDGAAVQVPFAISWSATLDPNLVNGGYNWQVSRSSTFAPLLLADSTRPSVTEDTISGLTNGTYFWRVQAAAPGGTSAWSQPRSFVVTGAGPGTLGSPVLAPTRGYSTFHPWESIHFDWTAVPGAVSYRLEVSNDPAFPMGETPPGTITFWNDNIPTNSDSYVHTMIGTFYARVFAVDADNPQDGVRSLPSNVIQFTCFYNNPIGPPPQLLSPLDNPTLTLPVTLSWAHVPNPQASGYVLEIATDPGFSNIEFFYNQFTEPTQVFLSLTSGPKFWRVLSQQGLSSPTTNANTAWSTTGRFTISSAPSTPVSITLSGSAPIAYSGAERRLALQLTAGVAAGGASVALASSHPALAPVPSTLSMPGGHAWAEIPIRFGQVTSPTVVTLSMTLNGVTATSDITLRPPALDDEFLQPEVRATGGAPMSGWVNLEGGGLAGPSGFVVNLSSSSAAVTLPASVTIAAGFHGAGFSMQTSAVDEPTVATITASANGATTSWPITLTPSAAPTKLIVRPMATTSGSQGVALGPEGVGHDQLMQVASSNPAVASVPGTVTVFAGSGIGFFNINTVPVTEPTQVLISLSGGGVTLTQPLTLYPSLPPLASIAVSPGTVVAGDSAIGTVTLGGPAPAVGVAVNLSSQLPLSAHVPDSVTIPAGATSATFPITTFPTQTTSLRISAAMDGVFLDSALTVQQAPSGASLSAVTVNPASVVGGSSATGTVTLSAAAPSGGAVISLSDTSSATTVPSSVTVPAGATSRTFTVTTSTVTSTTSSTITATFGGASRSVTLTVSPGAAPAPGAPSLLSPSNDATVAQPITFDWTDVANAASYVIQIDSSSTFSAPLTYTATVSVSQTTISGLPEQQLFWRVRGVNAAGAAGSFSSSRRFTVQGAPPPPQPSGTLAAPSLVSPSNDARFDEGRSITFDWSDVSGAASYTIQIDTSSTFSAPFTVQQTMTGSRFTTSSLPATRMWWRVRANDASGAPGAWSAVRRVEVKD